MLWSIFGNIKIVGLPKFELIWTMGSVSRMLLISPNFSLALWPMTNRSGEKPHFLVNGWPIGQFSNWSRPCWWIVNLGSRKSARWLILVIFLCDQYQHWKLKILQFNINLSLKTQRIPILCALKLLAKSCKLKMKT